MRALFGLGLALTMMIGAASGQEGDKEAKAVIDKAIQALGGKDKVNKYAASAIKGKGKVHVMNMELDLTGDFAFEHPDKLRQNIEVEVNNMKITVIQVYDGKNAWINTANETKQVDDDKLLTEFKEGMHAQRVSGLYKLDKGFTFSSVGDAKVKGKDAAVVRVSHKGKRDINLFFDKEKHLLVKAEYRSIEPMTMKEVNREEFYSDYKAVNGIQTAHKMVILHDGEPFMNMDVTEIRFMEKHDQGTFAKP